jgi:hypothetical protein
MIKNFDWQFIFKRFIICFIVLLSARIIVGYFNTKTIQFPSEYTTRAFTFALLYSLFSGFMQSKNKNNNQ